LRRPRQRPRQRGPLPGFHADNHDHPDDHDYDSDDNDDYQHQHDDDNDDYPDHFDDADRLDDNDDDADRLDDNDDDGIDARNHNDYADAWRDGGRRNSADEARASEGAGEAGQGRARCDRVARPEQSERAAVHRLPGLAAGSHRLSDAGRGTGSPESRVLRVELERRAHRAVETDLRLTRPVTTG
jgi:hypothetical protein